MQHQPVGNQLTVHDSSHTAKRILSFFFVLLSLVPSTCPLLSSALAATDELYFIYQDHLGSTTVITNESGEVVQQTRNFPYGADRINADGQRIYTERVYTGQIKDQATNLHYYNARYYDPTLGVFTSADTVNDGLNRFGYVGGNPVINTDPTGQYGNNDPYGDSGLWRLQSSQSNYSARSLSSYDPQQMAWEAFKVDNPSYDITWEQFMRDLESPWYLRQTPQGKFFGDIYDIGKSYAAALALHGFNALVARARISYSDWKLQRELSDRSRASIDFDPRGKKYYPELVTEVKKAVEARVENPDDPRELMPVIMQEAGNVFTYDIKFKDASMEVAAREGRGVCYHEAGLAAAVANKFGWDTGVTTFTGVTNRPNYHAVTYYNNPLAKGTPFWRRYIDPEWGNGPFTSIENYGRTVYGDTGRVLPLIHGGAGPSVFRR